MGEARGNQAGGDAQMYKQLVSFRKNLAEDIKRHQKLEDLLMRRDERIIHLRKNFKRVYDVRKIPNLMITLIGKC